MAAQRLDRVLACTRIGDPDGTHPIFDATGSKLAPGRWNTTSSPMLYSSEHYSTAMLEKLVRGSGHMPPGQHFITITIPNGVSYEVVTPDSLPGWNDISCGPSRAHGEAWQQERRSLLLIVPSVVARSERNVLLNPEHPEFGQVATSMHEPVCWDARLFR